MNSKKVKKLIKFILHPCFVSIVGIYTIGPLETAIMGLIVGSAFMYILGLGDEN
jgi:hypothetical protein